MQGMDPPASGSQSLQSNSDGLACKALWHADTVLCSVIACASGEQGSVSLCAVHVFCRRSQQASSLVVEVSRHRYGGRLVSVHSNIQLVNSSGLALQLGYLSPMGLSAQPLPLAVLAPGDSVWLPLQVCSAALYCNSLHIHFTPALSQWEVCSAALYCNSLHIHFTPALSQSL
jgi:hypothetical protein